MLDIKPDIIKLISLFKIIKYDVTKFLDIFVETKSFAKSIEITNSKINKYKSNTKYVKSDMQGVINILNELEKYLKSSNINVITNTTNTKNIMGLSGFSAKEIKQINTNEYVLNKKDLSILNEKINSKISETNISVLDSNKSKLALWAKSKGINPNILIQYLKSYAMFNSQIENYYSDYESDTNIDIKLLFKQMANDYDPITIAILFAYPYNICKKITKTPRYISIFNPSIINTYVISSNDKLTNPLDSIYLEDYIIYMYHDIEKEQIYGLGYVSMGMISLVNNIYNKELINKIHTSKSDLLLYTKNIIVNNESIKYKNSINNLLSRIISIVNGLLLDYTKITSKEKIFESLQKYDAQKLDNRIKIE